ncbi:hypothetical protein TWF718_002843 [Orbilia javanica]|uniref:DUF7924 domain-containing protein n=1 Tax=Orbilia javanica TaxID=47235 RepID=A0AAN8RAD5_9PEZI
MATHPISTSREGQSASTDKNKAREADTGDLRNRKSGNKGPQPGSQSDGTCSNSDGRVLEPPEGKRQLEPPDYTAGQPPQKRFKLVKNSPEGAELAGEYSGEDQDPIDYWTKTSRWPKDYAERKKKDYKMSHSGLFRKASNSLRRKRSETELSSPSTPSDQRPRDAKNIGYDSARYDIILESGGVFMKPSPLGITEGSKATCKSLLSADQQVPVDSLFREDLFEITCEKLTGANEARVMRDITQLIVPSAETLATFGSRHLDILSETCNAGWNSCIPFTTPRPQPDYAVGFKREAFTKAQFDTLLPFLGDFLCDQACFMATYFMFFPFLSCEVKCSGQPLEIADRQNAHSMGVATRAVVELFKLVGREQELNREILAFSISHDNGSVRIFGYYPVTDGDSVKYYRHQIRLYQFSANPDLRWIAYKFTKNVYDIWMPSHFKRLCSVIDQIPAGVDFNVTPLSQGSGFAQGSESASVRSDPQSTHSGEAVGVDISPNTSFAIPPPKKAKNMDTSG